MKNSEITDPVFREAVEAIDSGNVIALQELLQTNPELVTRRLDIPKEGYFAHPYLLWFIADNPVRHEKLPPDIVDVARTIIQALQKNPHGSYQHQLDYTLSLVCTGRIAKECAIQIPLIELLINEGANVKGNVLGAIGQYNFEAATYLLDKNADYNLATAVGLGRIDDVKKFLKTASASERYVALVVASFFGKADIIYLLIEAGADVNGDANTHVFDGFHSHASPLHQAVYSASLESVKLLVEAGADLNTTDSVYNGTPLGWAKYMQTETNDETAKKKYIEIENYLSSKQNK
jgi:hypothetical protein